MVHAQSLAEALAHGSAWRLKTYLGMLTRYVLHVPHHSSEYLYQNVWNARQNSGLRVMRDTHQEGVSKIHDQVCRTA